MSDDDNTCRRCGATCSNCSDDGKTRAQRIRDTADDLMGAFLYYGRKEDEDLQVGEIEDAILAEEIGVDDIVKIWRDHLVNAVATRRRERGLARQVQRRSREVKP